MSQPEETGDTGSQEGDPAATAVQQWQTHPLSRRNQLHVCVMVTSVLRRSAPNFLPQLGSDGHSIGTLDLKHPGSNPDLISFLFVGSALTRM